MARGVGARVHDVGSARRVCALGRRKIFLSAVECLLRHSDGTRVLREIAEAADPAAFDHSLPSASILICNSIVAIVDTDIAEDVCVIIGEEIPAEHRAGLRRDSLFVRGSYAVSPKFVRAQHAAIYAAIDRLAGTGRVPKFTVAIANAFHESDVHLVRKWSHHLAHSPDGTATKKVTIAGVLDSPHSVFFRERIFREVEALLIDLPALTRRLLLLSTDAIETYQDLDHLGAGAEFEEGIQFLDRCFRLASNDAVSTEVNALLAGPCSPEAVQILLKCGVTRVAVPAGLLPAAIISVAHSFAAALS